MRALYFFDSSNSRAKANFKLLIEGWQQMMYLLNLLYDFCKEG